MTAEPWVNRDGGPMAGLKFRTEQINLLTKSAKQDGNPIKAGDRNKVIKTSQQFN